MKSNLLTNLWVIPILIILTGCMGALTPLPTSQELVDLAFTQAAQTIAAEMTFNAPLVSATFEPSPPSSTPVPSYPPATTNTPFPTDTSAATEELLPTGTPSSSETAAMQTPEEEGFTLEFEDSFSRKSGWVVQSGDEYDMRYIPEGYAILVDIPKGTIWSVRSPEYADVRLEVTASHNQGPKDGYYGAVCRHVNGSNYYYLVASPEGFYGIGKMSMGQSSWLARGEDTSGTLLTGSGDLIRGDCIGEMLTLYVNGKMVLQAQDNELKTGDWGVAAGTRTGGGFDALFTKFALYLPK